MTFTNSDDSLPALPTNSDDDNGASSNDGSASSDPNVATQVATILMNSFCQKIDFSWAGQHISSVGYAQVVNALNGSPATLTATRSDTAGFAARYNYSTKVILLAPNWMPGDVINDLSLVHECTHAFQDIMSYPRSDNSEASGYLAGALYLLYRQNGSSALPGAPTPIHAASFDVAKIV
jgi:hypothetical protein